MNPFAFLPGWATLAAIGALMLALGVEEMRISSLKTEHAEYVAEVEKKARIAYEAALSEQARKQQAYDEEATHARTEIKNLEASVVQLASDGDRVRDELAAFRQRARAQPKPASGGKGKPYSDPLDLLSDLYARADREAAVLGGYADRLRVAATACERASDNDR